MSLEPCIFGSFQAWWRGRFMHLRIFVTICFLRSHFSRPASPDSDFHWFTLQARKLETLERVTWYRSFQSTSIQWNWKTVVLLQSQCYDGLLYPPDAHQDCLLKKIEMAFDILANCIRKSYNIVERTDFHKDSSLGVLLSFCFAVGLVLHWYEGTVGNYVETPTQLEKLRQVMAWLLSDVTHCRQGWPLWYITIKYPHQRDLSWKLLDWIFHLNIYASTLFCLCRHFRSAPQKHTLWSSWKRITAVRFIMFFFNFRSLHQLTSSVSPVHQYAMPGPGQMLTPEMMNLYHLDAWLIRPATQAKGCRLPAWESPMSTRWLQSVDWHLAGFNPQNWSRIIKETSFPTVIQPNRQRWVQSVQYSLHVGLCLITAIRSTTVQWWSY